MEEKHECQGSITIETKGKNAKVSFSGCDEGIVHTFITLFAFLSQNKKMQLLFDVALDSALPDEGEEEKAITLPKEKVN